MNDYIKTMRQIVGHETLFTVGCGIIIEDEDGRILLQKRKDQSNWCIPGGIMELGETFLEAARREVFEETNLEVSYTELFGIYSGQSCFAEYPNGYQGELKQEGEESFEHQFFHKHEIPDQLNPRQAPIILDWVESTKIPIVK